MDPLDSFVGRLEQLHQELSQSDSLLDPDSDVLKRLNDTVAEMKTAATKAMEDLKTESLALAAQMHEQAAKMEQEEQAAAAPPPPVEMPHPWEDHQGITDDAVQQIIASLVQAALPHSASPPNAH